MSDKRVEELESEVQHLDHGLSEAFRVIRKLAADSDSMSVDDVLPRAEGFLPDSADYQEGDDEEKSDEIGLYDIQH